MKSMLFCFYNKWQKLFTDAGFWLAIGFIVVLYASAEIYMDLTKYDEYSVWLSLVSFDRDFMMEHIEFSSVSILQKSKTGYLSMFIPMVAPFATVRLLCAEQESGVIRFEIVRCGRIKYHISNFISGVFSGGILASIGFIIYGFLIYLLFPKFGMYSAEMQFSQIEFYQMVYGVTLPTNYFVLLVNKLPIMFLYGVFASMPAVALTSILRNPYTILCLPFFFNYVLTQLTIKMMEKTNSGNLLYIRPSAWLEFVDQSDIRLAILIRCILLLFFAVFYLLMQNLKTDRGA